MQDRVGPTVELLTSTPLVTRSRKAKTGSVALTIRQLEVLQAIRRFFRIHGFSPARSELRRQLGLKSHAGVDSHIHTLASKGWVKTEAGVERSIVLRREGAPLYEPDALRPQEPKTGLRGERPPEPTWINDEVLWEIFGAMPDLCLRIRGDVVLRRVHAIDATTVELRPESRSRRHQAIRFDTRSDEVEIIGVVIGRMLAGAG